MLFETTAPLERACAVLILAGIPFFCACNEEEPSHDSCDALDSYDEDDMICCESYGIGAGGKPCCEAYEWMVAEECPDTQTTGGGQRVVEKRCCD